MSRTAIRLSRCAGGRLSTREFRGGRKSHRLRRPMFPPDLIARAAELVARYQAAGLMAATAESCTGGLIAGLLTEIPGLFGRARARLRRLFQRGQAGAARRSGRDAGATTARSAVRRRSRWRKARSRASRAEVAVSVTGNRRAGRRNGGEAGRPRPFRLRAARQADGGARGAVRRHRPRGGAARLGQGRPRSSRGGAQRLGPRGARRSRVPWFKPEIGVPCRLVTEMMDLVTGCSGFLPKVHVPQRNARPPPAVTPTLGGRA